MKKRVSDADLVKELEKLLDSVDGINRESLLFQIKALKLEQEAGSDFKTLGFTRASRSKLENKIEREKNLLSGYKKIIEADPSLAASLKQKCDYVYTKIYFLNKELSHTEDREDSKDMGHKTSGTVTFHIVEYECDPMQKTEAMDFVVDLCVKKTIVPASGKKISVELCSNREIELVVKAEGGRIIGLLFFPCENLIDLNEDLVYIFYFRGSAILKTKIDFQRQKRIARKNAEIVSVLKWGHELVVIHGRIAPLYCGVCKGIVKMFDESHRCKNCRFTCHKKCSSYILFWCTMSPQKEPDKTPLKRYNIRHKLEEEHSTGIRWCGHCGDRIVSGKKQYECSACGVHFHNECEVFLYPSCQLDLSFRKAVAEIKVPEHDTLKAVSDVSIDDFSLVKVLGRGSFGKVMLARHKKNKGIVAMKILKKESVVNANNLVYLEIERHVLELVSMHRHPFLMHMQYCFQDRSNVYFGTEYLPGGDLFHHISERTFSDKQNRLWISEIVLGIGFLHSKNIIYRDLKLDNIMLTADGHVKIADFGLCKEKVGLTTSTYTFCGTLDTIAPEVIRGKGYTKDADWWSLGVVMFEMYESESPFNGATSKELTSSILRDEPKYTSSTPDIARSLMAMLLEKDPEKRIGHGEADAESIKQHRYFEDVDWDAVEKREVVSEFHPGSKFSNFDQEFTDEPIVITPSNSVPSYEKFFTNFHG